MDFKLSYITDLVAVRLGEFPDWRRRRADPCRGVTLDESVAILLFDSALRLTSAAPLDSLGESTDFRNAVNTDSDWGELPFCSLEMPSDFLRLKVLMMPDWPHPLSESFRGDDAIIALGDAAPQWLAQRPRRPRLSIISSGISTTLRFGPTRATMPIAASYIPRPVYDSASQTLCNLDTSLLMPLAEDIAKTINSNN